MRTVLVTLILPLVSTVAIASEPATCQVEVRPTIDRGLTFLVKDALAWKKEHNCISCHHAALVVWAMSEAKQRGHAVDEPVLAELTKWSATTVGSGTTGVPRPASAPKAFNSKAIYFALAFNSVTSPDADVQKALPALVQTIETDQMEDGSWQSWPETRPPIFGYNDETVTIFEALALLPSAAGDRAAGTARDKGVKWLAEHPIGDDPQNVAMRLVLWQRLGRPADELQALAKRITDRQNADGGWSQAADMPSDAWATGQALYALAHVDIQRDNPAIQHAQAFLAKTQKEDGSWPMASRPIKPGGAGSTSLIPITGAGSAWAVLGLVRSTEHKEEKSIDQKTRNR